jgi:hypothetical protein
MKKMKRFSILLIIALLISAVSCKKTETEDLKPEPKPEQVVEKPDDTTTETSDFLGTYNCVIRSQTSSTTCTMTVEESGDIILISISGPNIDPTIVLTGNETYGMVKIDSCDDFCYQGDYHVKEGGSLKEINGKKILNFNPYDDYGSNLLITVEEI